MCLCNAYIVYITTKIVHLFMHTPCPVAKHTLLVTGDDDDDALNGLLIRLNLKILYQTYQMIMNRKINLSNIFWQTCITSSFLCILL